MSDNIQTVAELFKLYRETTATAVTIVGNGDYGIEAEWVNGSRYIVCLGIRTAREAADFARFLAAALSTPKLPTDDQRRTRDESSFLLEMWNTSARIPDPTPFKGYNVVAVSRTVVHDDMLPKFEL